jgi:hypothetical protein
LIKDFKDKKESSHEYFVWLVSTYQYVPINEKYLTMLNEWHSQA